MSSLTPLQLAASVALGGSVLAVVVPTFLEDLHASRIAEPLDGLARIAASASATAAGAPARLAYPASAPRTPAEVPSGERVLDPPGTWDHPTWRLLGFSLTTEHSYAFAFDSQLGEGASTFTASAHGDLDGDGELSSFRVSGESRDGEHPRLYPVRIDREVE